MNKRNFYIGLFAVLYLIVAVVSTIHAISFFALANAMLLGVLLAIGFEVGQAAVLFSILTSPSERNKYMPWILMCVLTVVQILGNVFSSYKYLMMNSAANLQYFKEPILGWVDMDDKSCNVILTYIIGGILPLVSLFMTSMVTNYIGEEKNKNIDNEKTIKEIADNLTEEDVFGKEPEEETGIEIPDDDTAEDSSRFINI